MPKLYNVSPHALVVPSLGKSAASGEAIDASKEELDSLAASPDWSEKAPAKNNPASSPAPIETSAESENKED